METKLCTKCGKSQPVSNFNTHKGGANGLRSWCKVCCKTYYREVYRVKHRDKANLSQRVSMLKKYGADVSVEQLKTLHALQNDRCAICGRKETSRNRGRTISLSLDHNHQTGKIRALLCRKCNTGIGAFLENPALLRKAADYLDTYA